MPTPRNSSLKVYEMADIRIFQTFHKSFVRNTESDWIVPIGVNGYYEAGLLSDAKNDNISHLNPYYCELTAQYWVWKNCRHDYVGFYHYRRYLNFCVDKTYESSGQVIAKPSEAAVSYLSSEAQLQRLERLLTVAPVILPNPQPTLPSISGQYLGCVSREPWDKFIAELLAADEPKSQVESYFGELTSAPMCNVMVMRWDLFSSYLSDLFPILDRIFGEIGPKYDTYNNRYPGFIAERYLGYWIHSRRIPFCTVPMIFLD